MFDCSDKATFYGFSKQTQSEQIVNDIYQQWLSQKTVADLGWGMLFCGEKLRGDIVFNMLRQQFNFIPLFGGSTSGINNCKDADATGFETLLILFPKNISAPKCFQVNLVDEGVDNLDHKLDELIAPLTSLQSKLLLASTLNQHRCLNLSSVLEKYQSVLSSEQNQKIVGSVLTSKGHPDYCFLFTGHQVIQNSLLCLEFTDSCMGHFSVNRHSSAISSFLKVTKAKANTLLQLDNQPVIEVLSSRVTEHNRFNDTVFIGQKQGALFNPDEKAIFKVFLATIDRDSASVECKDWEFKRGDLIQVMSIDEHNPIAIYPNPPSSISPDASSSLCSQWQFSSIHLQVSRTQSPMNNRLNKSETSNNIKQDLIQIYSEQEIIMSDEKLMISCGYQIGIKIDQIALFDDNIELPVKHSKGKQHVY